MSATNTTDCTYCGANAGAPCRTATGNRANRPHAARTNAAPATTGTDDRTEVEESTGPSGVEADIDRINRVFEENNEITPEINELLGVWDDGPVKILTDQEQARLDELLDKNRTLVDEMRILTKRITAARRTDQTEASPAPMTVRESSSGTWYVAKSGRWKVRLDGDDHATAVRDSTHVYRVVRELVVDTRVSRSIRNPGHILDLVDRARRTATAAGRDDSPAPPPPRRPLRRHKPPDRPTSRQGRASRSTGTRVSREGGRVFLASSPPLVLKLGP